MLTRNVQDTAVMDEIVLLALLLVECFDISTAEQVKT